MSENEPRHANVIILGAGFSACAGLPIQREFSELLLSPEFGTELDSAITEALKTFLREVFAWTDGMPLPELEDIFTCIDLAAGDGHHLGIQFGPKRLRAIRRMAIYRIFSILDNHFTYSNDIETLIRAYLAGSSGRSAFVVLNWDIVLEKHLIEMLPRPSITYCCRSYDWHSDERNNDPDAKVDAIPICKMHGSSNWVYCDNCHSLFYDLYEKLPLKVRADLVKSDFRLFDERFTDKVFDDGLGITPEERECRFCKNMVSSHIATFSYRKSFRTHAYAGIWNRAAEILADADRWIFIGYSLPKADFELKHLLKTAQLRFAHTRKRKRPLEMHIVTKTKEAFPSYERLFGKRYSTFCDGGLQEYISSGLFEPLSS